MVKPLNRRPRLTRYNWIIIALSWLAIQIILFTIYGVNTREESLTHISFAENFFGTTKFELHRLWYFGYTLLLIFIRILHLPYESMYVLQLGLSFVSLIYFIRIASIWSTSQLAVLLAGILYATCFIIQQWINFLFTDAVFSFLLVVSTYYLLEEDKSLRHRIIFWLLLIILPFFRPVGFLFVLMSCLHWIFSFQRDNIWKIVAASIYLSILGLLIYQSIVINSGYFYPFNNLDAEIICGRSSDLLQYQVVPYTNETKIAEYFWNNPEMTVRLFSQRFYKTFSMTRSYFSATHNIVIAVACIIYYALAAIGVFHLLANRIKNHYFLIAACFIFSVPSVIFCVEWHGRMSVPILCFILMLATMGIDKITNGYKKNEFRPYMKT